MSEKFVNSFDHMQREINRRTQINKQNTSPHSSDFTIKAPSFVRTQHQSDNTNSRPINDVETSAARNTEHAVRNTADSNKSQKSGSLFDMLNLKNIDIDGDRMLILMMLALLSGKKNESDDLLMLALMYIML